MEKSILLNTGYGYGPFLRTLDLAVELGTDQKIIVPEIFVKKQKELVREIHPGLEERLVYDSELGKILNSLFYRGEKYEDSLRNLIENYSKLEERFREEIKKYEIELEISRNPRISSGIPNSYYTSMGLFSEFLEASMEKGILERNIGSQATEIAKHIESKQKKVFISEPRIFELKESHIGIPFIVKKPDENNDNIESGVYVYNSGIENLKEISPKDVTKKIYDSTMYSPRIISNKNIEAVITRAGLGIVSESLLAEKPLIILPYQQGDDFEMYFNIQRFKRLDLVQVYDDSLSFEENLRLAKSKLRNIQNYKIRIMRKYGTLDGIKYTASLINQDLKK